LGKIGYGLLFYREVFQQDIQLGERGGAAGGANGVEVFGIHGHAAFVEHVIVLAMAEAVAHALVGRGVYGSVVQALVGFQAFAQFGEVGFGWLFWGTEVADSDGNVLVGIVLQQADFIAVGAIDILGGFSQFVFKTAVYSEADDAVFGSQGLAGVLCGGRCGGGANSPASSNQTFISYPSEKPLFCPLGGVGGSPKNAIGKIEGILTVSAKRLTIRATPPCQNTMTLYLLGDPPHWCPPRARGAPPPLPGGGGGPPPPLTLDFSSYLKRSGSETLPKTLRGMAGAQVADATAGWGKDAWLLASRGFSLTLYEQNPYLHTLLAAAGQINGATGCGF